MTFFGAVAFQFNTKDPYGQEDYMDVLVTRNWDTENGGSLANIWDDIKDSTDLLDLAVLDLGFGNGVWAKRLYVSLLEVESDGTISDTATLMFSFGRSGMGYATYYTDPDSGESSDWFSVPPIGSTVKALPYQVAKYYMADGI